MGQWRVNREKVESEKAGLIAAGLVKDRYSGVSSIVFQMTYYQRALMEPVLMTRTLNYAPADYAFFHMKCMREQCTDGGFDLGPVVARLVKSHKKSVKGTIFCHGSNETIGHARIAYEVNIQYNKQKH